MTRHTITLPEPISDYIDRGLAEGSFDSLSDYVVDLIGRDISRRETAENALRAILDDAENSGISERTLEDILTDARSSRRKSTGAA